MSDLKITDFKMLEKPPYKLPEPRSMIELVMTKGVKEEEKMYGPVFTTKFVNFTLQYVAQKYGEKPKEAIKTLDQLGAYLVSISDKHPKAFTAAMYAHFKVENDLQGSAGAATRVTSRGISKNFTEGTSIKERNIDVDQLLKTFQQTIIPARVGCEMGYKKNEEGSVDLIWPDCYFKDACQTASGEDALKRVIGGVQCEISSGICQFLKLLSSYDWDYQLLEFDKPHCISRLFII
ncbi:MAG: hypothetical protein WED07_14845 [Candidatus Freyarchaeum deiterrae]